MYSRANRYDINRFFILVAHSCLSSSLAKVPFNHCGTYYFSPCPIGSPPFFHSLYMTTPHKRFCFYNSFAYAFSSCFTVKMKNILTCKTASKILTESQLFTPMEYIELQSYKQSIWRSINMKRYYLLDDVNPKSLLDL